MLQSARTSRCKRLRGVDSVDTRALSGVIAILHPLRNELQDKREAHVPRIAYIDNLKGVLITLVVIGHFAEHVMDYSGSGAILAVFNFIYTFHMPLFLLCSGLFAANSFRKGRGFQPQNVLLYLVLFLIFYSLKYIEDATLLGKDPHFNPLYVNSGSWYLLVLALFSLLTPVLDRLRAPWAIGAALALSVASCLWNNDPTFLSLSRFFTYLPWYTLGYYLTAEPVNGLKAKLRAMGRAKHVGIACAAAAFLAVYLVWLYFGPEDVVHYNRWLATGVHAYDDLNGLISLPVYVLVLVRVAHYALVGAVGFAVMLLVPEGRSYLTTVGERSLQVYIVHLLFIYWYAHMGFDGVLVGITPYWAIFGPFVMGIGVTLLLSIPKSPNVWVKKLKKLCEKPFTLE